MKMKYIYLTATIFIILTIDAKSCSTFMLHSDTVLIYGQNLDMPYSIPGYITKNNRGIVKQSITWNEVSQDGINNSPRKIWTSKFGSITFTPMCKEFPEGGVNEAGLYVREMSLPGTTFPKSESKPNMFMMQWIQYQLDNYSSVQQVIDHIDDIIIDGWAWHFFVADSTGNAASVEFLNGEAVIYSGDEMPYKIMTNSTYESELNNISIYEGFGGSLNVETANNRFVKTAVVMKTASAENLSNPVDFGFDVLKHALGNSGTRWSVVIDVKNAMIHFKSSIGKEIKHFSFKNFGYDCNSPVMICDINLDASGDITDSFVPYTREKSLEYISNGIEKVFGKSSAPAILKNTHNYRTCCEIDYFGQEPPGDSLKVFASGFISLQNRSERCLTISPDGTEAFLQTFTGGWSTQKTKYYINTDAGWKEQELPLNLQPYNLGEPAFSPDGQRLYFTFNPTPEIAYQNYIYYIEKEEETWSDPIKMDDDVNFSSGLFHPSISENGNLYFAKNGKLYISRKADLGYEKATILPTTLNAPEAATWDAYIAPNEEYILFKSNKKGGFGSMDIYISFKKENGEWTNLKNMGAKINSANHEDGSDITPDGRYLTLRTEVGGEIDLYWISFPEILDSLKKSNFAPYKMNDIPSDTFYTGIENSYTLPDNSFIDDDGYETLTYSASIKTGEKLPDWLNFDSETKTFSGTPTATEKITIKVSATDTAGESVSDEFTLSVFEGAVGMKEIINNENISIYPNPAKGIIHIKNDLSARIFGYAIMDLSGETIKQGNLNSPTINITGLTKGMYFISLQTDKGHLDRKIIIE